MKVELSIAHFLLLGIAGAVLLFGLIYGVYRIARRGRMHPGEVAAHPDGDDDA